MGLRALDGREFIRRAGAGYPNAYPRLFLLQFEGLIIGCKILPKQGALCASRALGHQKPMSVPSFQQLMLPALQTIGQRYDEISVAGLEAEGREWPRDDEGAFKAPIRAKYEAEGSPYYATARLWDDGIVTPRETRRVLSLAFSATLNARIEPTRFGVFRM